MFKFKRIFVLLLIFGLSTTLVACSCGKNKDNSDPEEIIEPKTSWESDKLILEKNGFQVSLYNSYLDRFELLLVVPSGSLQCVLDATSVTGSMVSVYYFASAASAKQCYDKISKYVIDSYDLKGNKLLYGDVEEFKYIN